MSITCNQQQKQVKIELISESFVKPKHEIEASKQPLYLAAMDLVILQIHPIQKGLLYNKNSHTTISNLLDKLKESLSIALLHFYPLAGRLETRKFEDENACTVYIDCNKGPGARIIHATAVDVTISDILSPVDHDVPKFVHSLFDLGEIFVNYDCHDFKRPLLSIQVTELVDGVFIGFTMSHCVVDGTSFMHFVSMLSEIYRSNNDESSMLEVSRVPIFDYKPWCDTHDTAIKLPYLELEKVITRSYPKPLRERIFHFSSTSLAHLKDIANKECKTRVVSSFQALAGFMWRSITRARKLGSDQDTTCCMLTNARPRLEPSITDDYFGNFISQAKAVCKVDELLGHDLGWAALGINDEIMVQNNGALSICDMYKFIADHVSKMGLLDIGDDAHGPNSMIIGGSARFDMYGPEFGLGKAVGVRMGYASKEDGKITANPGREGGGSVDLEVSLKAENMTALEADEEFMSFVSFNTN